MTTDKAPPPNKLAFELQAIRIDGIGTNYERHGEELVIAHDVRVHVQLVPALCVQLLGEYCDRTLFNTRKDGVIEPTEVFRNSKLPIDYDEDLDAECVTFVLSDGVEREFENCPISAIKYAPAGTGGVVDLFFNVRTRPADEHESWAFLEHHKRPARMSISSSHVKLKKNPKQSELPLNQGGNTEQQPQLDLGASMAAARAGTSAPDGEQRTTITNGNGETLELRSAKEIDDEMRARNPDGETMGAIEDPNEAAAREQVAAFERGSPPNGSSTETH